jgi:hypothetical protein
MHRVVRSAVVTLAESLRLSFAHGASGILPSLILMTIEIVHRNVSRLPGRARRSRAAATRPSSGYSARPAAADPDSLHL